MSKDFNAKHITPNYYFGNYISQAVIPAKAGIYENNAGFRVMPGMTFTYLVAVVIITGKR
jgi:hypothetical protein